MNAGKTTESVVSMSQLTIDYIEKIGITDSKDSLAQNEEDFEALGLISAASQGPVKDGDISGESPVINIIRSV